MTCRALGKGKVSSRPTATPTATPTARVAGKTAGEVCWCRQELGALVADFQAQAAQWSRARHGGAMGAGHGTGDRRDVRAIIDH